MTAARRLRFRITGDTGYMARFKRIPVAAIIAVRACVTAAGLLLVACAGGAGEKAVPPPVAAFPVSCLEPGGKPVAPTRMKCVIDANVNMIYDVYRPRFQENPALYGKIVIQIHLLSDGKIGQATVVENSTGDAPLADGLAAVLTRMNFGPGIVEQTISYPIEFVP